MNPETPIDGENLSGSHTFPKLQKLKHRKSIQYLFDKGASFVIGPLRIVYVSQVAIPESALPKFAVSVSKRNFTRAVDRNSIKRKIREAYRLNKSPLMLHCEKNHRALHMMWIFTGKAPLEYKDIVVLVQKIVSKLLLRLSKEAGQPHT